LHATAEFTSSKTTLIGWEIYFYSAIFISTTLLVFPPTRGTQPFFYWRDIAKMRIVFLKIRKNSDFGGYQSPELRGKKS
jgi:hypothetical protein